MGSESKVVIKMIFALLLLFSAQFCTGCTTGDRVDGWVCHGHGWYKYFEIKCPFYDAVNHCRKNRAVLASIHNKSENDFVASLVGTKKAWIGGTRRYGNVFWWPYSKSTSMNYVNYAQNEPNNRNANGPENCLEIFGNTRSGRWFSTSNRCKWNDNYCGNQRDGPDGFVCESARDVH